MKTQDSPKIGEWFVGNPIRSHDTIGICVLWQDGEETGEETIAEVLPGCSREKMLEQAHLLASAPALYAALEAILTRNGGDLPAYMNPALEQARAALTLATPPAKGE